MRLKASVTRELKHLTNRKTATCAICCTQRRAARSFTQLRLRSGNNLPCTGQARQKDEACPLQQRKLLSTQLSNGEWIRSSASPATASTESLKRCARNRTAFVSFR